MILTAVLSCSGDKPIESPNNAPVISIQAESDVLEVQENQYESLSAIVSDQDHNFNELEVRWSTDQRVTCDWTPPSDDGESLCVMYLNRSESSIIAEVRDPKSAATRDEIQVNVFATEVQADINLLRRQWYQHRPNRKPVFTCLSESGVVGRRPLTPQATSFKAGSIFVYSPE